jgi:carbon-monoxide dehydrogenase medium subunit
MDIAVVGAASWLRLNAAHDTIEAARVALGAVAPTPVAAEEVSRWLVGKPANEATYAAAADIARQAARPISDKRGTTEYRRHLAGVLVQRTLAIAAERARGPQVKIH